MDMKTCNIFEDLTQHRQEQGNIIHLVDPNIYSWDKALMMMIYTSTRKTTISGGRRPPLKHRVAPAKTYSGGLVDVIKTVGICFRGGQQPSLLIILVGAVGHR